MDIGGLLEKLRNMSESLPGMRSDDSPRPGQVAAKKGLKVHHPVVIIPGFVTSGLELWQGEECAQSYFRQRLWGTLSMAQTLLSDRACWMRHMKLDPVTGSDPPGIKLRAAKALEAVDYFVPGYWVFSKLVQSLADIGYDNNNLVAVPYDWRLPISVMESRDGFFTRTKVEVEQQYKLSKGVKPVMASHSYGAQVVLAFLNWVEQQEPGWVDKHMHAYVNLAGPMLGLPKAISPLLSGETRETVDMMAGLAVLVEQYLGKQSRAALFRTWGSAMAMMPVGGPKVWGNATFAPDDDANITAAGRSYGGIIALVNSGDDKLRDAVRRNDSSQISGDSLNLLHRTLSNWGNLVRSFTGSSEDTNQDSDGADSGNSNSSNDKQQHEVDKRKQDEDESSKQHAPPAAAHQSSDAQQSEESQKQGSRENEEEQVRFLDVHSAIYSLALAAGKQFTTNMQRWAPAAKVLDFSAVLAHHSKAAEKIARQRMLKAKVGQSQQIHEGESGPDRDTASTESIESSKDQSCSWDGSDGSCSSDVKNVQDSMNSFKANKENNKCGDSNHKHKGEKQGSRKEETTDTKGGTGSDEELVSAVDPVVTPLPKAPNFKLYCFYGIGTATERGYHYLKTRRNNVIEWSVNNMANDPKSGLLSGVQLAPDGDGTVPLLSLGAMCAGGWKSKRLNPSGLEVITREYPHNPTPVLKDARGGPGASTHVEILGNELMLMDLLHVAAGKGDTVTNDYKSNVQEIASKIPWDDL
eukprot:GHRR01013206.1.p1 GENE.GHRR01013206.1~~GHRR01013206.1.p1  ORF type:complete len:750 (+),score=225.44 GHRR01013206.1:937-3186(+)